MSSLPLCAASAPQQRCARGTTTRQPLRASTRIVARLTSWNHRSCTHPARTATVPRTSVPAAGSVTRGNRANGDVRRGASARIRRGRNGRAMGWKNVAVRRSAGCGSTTSSPSHRRNRARRVRSGSTWTRARSIIRPNGTCDGQTSSHARHTRHRSMNPANVSSTTAVPSATERMAAIRPRGDADSSPVNRYVGQWGRHRPHATHDDRSASDGASVPTHPGCAPASGPMNRNPSGSSDPSGKGSRSPSVSTSLSSHARLATTSASVV